MGSPRVAAPLAVPAGTSQRRARLPLAGFVLFVALLAGAGAYLALGIVGGQEPAGQDAPVQLSSGPFGTAQDIPVSFGAIAVPYVDKVAGTKPKEVQGQNHNIAGYVPPDKEQIHVNVGLTNLLDAPEAYSPAQFRLVAGDGDRPGSDDKRLAPLGGTIQAGTLQPDAGIEGRITFVTKRDRSRLWLEFKDPRQEAPVVIDLGRTGKTPSDAFEGFQGHGGHR